MDCSRRRFLVAGSLAAVGTGVGSTAAHAETTKGSAGEPGLGDPVYPGLGNGGYRVASYHLDFDCSQGTKQVSATTTITARAEQELRSFNLDAAGLEIGSVQVNGRAARFDQDGEELVVRPAHRLHRRLPFVVTVKYTVEPGKIPPPDGGWVTTPDGFATAPQPAGAHTIFPCNDHPSDKARYTIRITAPRGLDGVASGIKLKEHRHADGSTTTLWAPREPMATELVQISVGAYKTIERGHVGGTFVRDVVPVERAADLEPALALTPGLIRWLVPYLGDHPFEAYGLLPANSDDPDAFDFTGLETQTLTLYKPGFLAQEEKLIGSHMMHELVHNWWGNSVSPATWSDLWINEGHADFYGLIYRYERGWEDSNGFVTMAERMKYTYGQGDIWRSTSGPVAKPDAENLFDNQRYTGGVLVLYALRERIGEKAFMKLERRLLAERRNRTISTEDYIDAAARISADSGVRAFLEDWLYGSKIPPMPNHPDWKPEPVPTMRTRSRARVQTDRYGI